VSIPTVGSPNSAIVDRYSGGYLIGAVEDSMFKVYALNKDGDFANV